MRNRNPGTPRVRGERPARADLYRKMRKLVHMIARNTLTSDRFEDRVQEGWLGLLHAWSRYDGSKGWKFSTYAYICIRGAILNARRLHGLIKIGSPAYPRLFRKWMDARKRLGIEESLCVAVGEFLADDDHDSPVAGMRASARMNVIRSAMAGAEFIKSPSPRLMRQAEKSGQLLNRDDGGSPSLEHSEAAERAVLDAGLTDNEFYVVAAYFGMFGKDAIPRKRIASEMGISRERVRQLGANALWKVRRSYLRSCGEVAERMDDPTSGPIPGWGKPKLASPKRRRRTPSRAA